MDHKTLILTIFNLRSLTKNLSQDTHSDVICTHVIYIRRTGVSSRLYRLREALVSVEL